jgi:hypothetical protein
MQPICNTCQSSKLNWRMVIDSIQSRNHHFSSGTRERTSAEKEDVQTRRQRVHLTDLLDYSLSETVLVPTSELHETMQPWKIIIHYTTD